MTMIKKKAQGGRGTRASRWKLLILLVILTTIERVLEIWM